MLNISINNSKSLSHEGLRGDGDRLSAFAEHKHIDFSGEETSRDALGWAGKMGLK